MPPPETPLLLGEAVRSLDERYRVSIPPQMAEPLLGDSPQCLLVKERPGCLSLWNAALWRRALDRELELVQSKLQAGRLAGRLGQVQTLGRLLSTRQTPVELKQRTRLLIPEGFREVLGAEPRDEVILVGAALCLEIWQAAAWKACLTRQLPRFRRLLDRLSR